MNLGGEYSLPLLDTLSSWSFSFEQLSHLAFKARNPTWSLQALRHDEN